MTDRSDPDATGPVPGLAPSAAIRHAETAGRLAGRLAAAGVDVSGHHDGVIIDRLADVPTLVDPVVGWVDQAHLAGARQVGAVPGSTLRRIAARMADDPATVGIDSVTRSIAELNALAA